MTTYKIVIFLLSPHTISNDHIINHIKILEKNLLYQCSDLVISMKIYKIKSLTVLPGWIFTSAAANTCWKQNNLESTTSMVLLNVAP